MLSPFFRHIARDFWKEYRNVIAGTACGLLAVAYPSPVLAHEGQPPAPHDLWTAWNWDPLLLSGLALATWLYGRGVHRLWQRAGVGRGISCGQAVAYAGGLLTLFVALVSPLDPLGEALFSAHMVQHLLLMIVAASLLVLGTPVFAFLWALPPRWRQAVGRWWQQASVLHKAWHLISHPSVVWLLYAITLWFWHFPRFYEAALRYDLIHELEHFSFLATAALFWWVLFSPMARRQLSRGASILYLFTTSLHSTALGVLITLSPEPWYTEHAAYTEAWNLTLLQDQQLAGNIMWMPMCMVYVLVAAALFAMWLQEIDQQPAVESLE